MTNTPTPQPTVPPVQQPPQHVQLFPGKAHAQTLGIFMLVGAGALLLFAVVGFLVAIGGSGGQLRLHSMTTVPVILAVGLLLTGLRSIGAPMGVQLSEQGVVIFGKSKVIGQWPWTDIAMAKTEAAIFTGRKMLVLTGSNGKQLATIQNDIERFNDMVAAIDNWMAANPSPQVEAVGRRKTIKNGLILTPLGLVFVALGIGVFLDSRSEAKVVALFDSSAAPATGVIVDKIIAPNGHTKRIYFQVKDAGPDVKVHNVEADPLVWEWLDVGDEIPILAVPDRPDIAKMVTGQIEGDSLSPGLMSGASIIMALLGLLGLIAGILALCGIDIDVDSKTGLQVKRYGKQSSVT